MVQLTNDSRFGQKGDFDKEPDLYRKLDDGVGYDSTELFRILEERRFSPRANTPRERLKELYVRSQRGFVSYEMLKLPELKSLVGQRGIPIAADQKDTPWFSRAILERADDNVTFDRFTDLQPELRLLIYTHHFKSFVGARGKITTQPPITGVGQSIRKESLPVFDGRCIFKVSIPAFPNPRYSINTHYLLERTTTEQFGWIRNINVSLSVAGHLFSVIIDICNKSSPVKVIGYSDLREKPVHHLSLDLDALIRTIAAREGSSKLQASDTEQFYDKAGSIIAQYGKPAA